MSTAPPEVVLPAGWELIPEDDTCTTVVSATLCLYSNVYDLRVIHGFRYEDASPPAGAQRLPIGQYQTQNILGGPTLGGANVLTPSGWGSDALG